MFATFKNLVRRLVDKPNGHTSGPGDTEVIAVPMASDEAPAYSQPAIPMGHSIRPQPLSATARKNGHHNGRCIDISLKAILANLPLELQPRVRNIEVGEATV